MDTQNDGPWKRWFLLNMAIFGISKSMSNFWGVNLFKRTVFVGSSPALASKKHGSSAIQVHLRTENWDAADQACRSGSSTKCTGQKGGTSSGLPSNTFFASVDSGSSGSSGSCRGPFLLTAQQQKLSFIIVWFYEAVVVSVRRLLCQKSPFCIMTVEKKTTTTESDNRIFLYQFFLGKL